MGLIQPLARFRGSQLIPLEVYPLSYLGMFSEHLQITLLGLIQLSQDLRIPTWETPKIGSVPSQLIQYPNPPRLLFVASVPAQRESAPLVAADLKNCKNRKHKWFQNRGQLSTETDDHLGRPFSIESHPV
jgi:hypothetical protein